MGTPRLCCFICLDPDAAPHSQQRDLRVTSSHDRDALGAGSSFKFLNWHYQRGRAGLACTGKLPSVLLEPPATELASLAYYAPRPLLPVLT